MTSEYIPIHRTPYFSLPIILLLIGSLSLVANLYFYSSFSHQHYLFIGGLLICFMTFYFLKIITFKARVGSNTKQVRRFEFNGLLLNIYAAFGAIGAIIATILFMQRGIFGLDNIFQNLRSAKTVDMMPTYGASHFALLGLIASVIMLIKNRIKCSILLLVLSFFPAVLGVDRTAILYGMMFYAYFYAKTHGFNYKIIGVFFTTFLIIAIALGVLANKAITATGEFFVIPYFSYGLEAFGQRLVGADFRIPASEVFGVLGSPIDFIAGRSVSLYDLEDKGLFNVYSYVYKPYFLLGEAGFFALMSGLGFFLFAVDELAKRNIYFLFVNASLLYSVVMIFYDWTFSLTTHYYVMLAASPLLFRLNAK